MPLPGQTQIPRQDSSPDQLQSQNQRLQDTFGVSPQRLRWGAPDSGQPPLFNSLGFNYKSHFPYHVKLSYTCVYAYIYIYSFREV